MAYPDLKNVYPVAEKAAGECAASLWGMEWTTESGRRVLRVYVDREQGVDLETLTAVTRTMNARLDEMDPFEGAWTLEVSSPGLDRRLFTLAQCVSRIGSTVRIKCTPTCGLAKKRYRGTLLAVEENILVLQCDPETIRLPFDQTASIHLVYGQE